MDGTVSREVWEERSKNISEQFGRDKERIDKTEEQVEKITLLTIQMGEILKQNDTKLNDHDKRLGALENRPSKWFDRTVSGLIGALATGLGAAVASQLFR